MNFFDLPKFENPRGMIFIDEPELSPDEHLIKLIEWTLIQRLIKAEREGKEITKDDEKRMLEDITKKVLIDKDPAEIQRMAERERMEEDACMQVKIREDGERYSQGRRSEQRCPDYSRFIMHSCSVKSEKKQKEIKRKMIKKTKARSFHLFKNLLNTNKKRITRMKGKRGGRR